MRTITTAVVVVAVLGVVPPEALGARARRGSAFDLAVVPAMGAGAQLAPTDRLLLSATVENGGGRTAPGSRTRFVITRARRPLASDARLASGIAVPRVRSGGRRVLRSVLAVVPPTARSGVYRIFACVAVGSPAKEIRRGNNYSQVGHLSVRVPGPLDVSPVLDFRRAVSATVDATGGTLEAPVADGSALRLTLPKGALTDPVTVKLVPVTRLDRFSVRGASVLEGVQIEPG